MNHLPFDPLRPRIAPGGALDAIERLGDGDSDASPQEFVVYSIHDGDWIPDSLARASDPAAFVRERDFGADAVAAGIAAELSIPARLRVRLARCLLDAGRRFGLDDGKSSHTTRSAVPAPIAERADPASLAWLEAAYARIEENIAQRVSAAGRAPIAIGVHTYDPFDADGSPRPELSLLDLPESVARGVTDFLPRSTADSRKLDAILDALVARGFTVRRNDPYLLPDGSIEVRLHRRARRESWPNRDRLQAFVLEVRKDLICSGSYADGYFAATAVRADAAAEVGRRLARALSSLTRP